MEQDRACHRTPTRACDMRPCPNCLHGACADSGECSRGMRQLAESQKQSRSNRYASYTLPVCAADQAHRCMLQAWKQQRNSSVPTEQRNVLLSASTPALSTTHTSLSYKLSCLLTEALAHLAAGNVTTAVAAEGLQQLQSL